MKHALVVHNVSVCHVLAYVTERYIPTFVIINASVNTYINLCEKSAKIFIRAYIFIYIIYHKR